LVFLWSSDGTRRVPTTLKRSPLILCPRPDSPHERPMRSLTIFAVAVGLLALTGGATADEKADKQALKDLEGTYALVSLEAPGLKFTEEQLKKVPEADRRVVIKGEQITVSFGGKDDTATIKLDAAQKPAHITITATKDGKTEVNYGIYKFENGVLTLCSTEKGEAKDRPKEFKFDGKEIVWVLKKLDKK
jgi:uncharacterized protein (TIGR03067 family)